MAGAAEELASATADIVAPIRVLHVLGAGDVIEQFRFQIGEVLQLLVVRMAADRYAILGVRLRRVVERVTKGLGALCTGCKPN